MRKCARQIEQLAYRFLGIVIIIMEAARKRFSLSW